MPIIKISPNIKAQRDGKPRDKMRDSREIGLVILIYDRRDFTTRKAASDQEDLSCVAKSFNLPGRYKKLTSVCSHSTTLKYMQKMTESQGEIHNLPSKWKIFNTVISVTDKLSRQERIQWI